MKTVLLFCLIYSNALAQLFVSELERNPIGPETETPGGKSHEYIELVNLTSDTFAIDQLVIFDGAIRDKLIPKFSKVKFVPGSVLLILDPDYFSEASQFPISYDTSDRWFCGRI